MALKLITGFRLIDGTGNAPVDRAAVIIRDKHIVAVGPQDEIGQSALVKDSSDSIEVWDAAGANRRPYSPDG